MREKNMTQEFRLKNTKEMKNYFIKELDQNELKCKQHEKVSATLNYIEHVGILVSVVTGCISISAFTFLIGVLGKLWEVQLVQQD